VSIRSRGVRDIPEQKCARKREKKWRASERERATNSRDVKVARRVIRVSRPRKYGPWLDISRFHIAMHRDDRRGSKRITRRGSPCRRIYRSG